MESAGLVLANHYFFLNSQLPNLILEGIMIQILSQNTEQFDNVFTWDSTAFHIFTLESVILYVSAAFNVLMHTKCIASAQKEETTVMVSSATAWKLSSL